MDIFTLIKRNLFYFWKKNLSLAFGVAISAAVITGSLIVGDSVRYSLERIVDHRLGKIEYVVRSGDRFFSHDLSLSLSKEISGPVSAALLTDGIAVVDGGRLRIGNVQVLGVDRYFDEFSGTGSMYADLAGDEVIISENLADRLGVSTGDDILLRLTRTSLIPLNAPFVSDRENIVSTRMTVRGIAGRDEMGMFNLRNSQTAPFNAFISYNTLCDLMEFNNRANLLFLPASPGLDTAGINTLISENWKPEDAGLSIRKILDGKVIQVTSDRVFIDNSIAGAMKIAGKQAEPVLTYFVNSISTGNRTTPYSFVTGLPGLNLGKNDIIINSWLAEDLNAGPGDSIDIEYFLVGPLRTLTTARHTFRVSGIVGMEGEFADGNLMPDLPGLSDAGNCRDWQTGVPISLEEIRDKDEDYWKDWKGTPKAFISLESARDLWANRFGSYTAFRFPVTGVSEDDLGKEIMSQIRPGQLGFTVEDTRSSGNYAARNGVSFSQLFAGLSFFLLLGGIFLSVLLFILNLESRKDQLNTLVSLGIPGKMIRKVLMSEGLVISFLGSLLGMGLAILYNQLIFKALNTIWSDIVRTDVMLIDIRPVTLVSGLFISLLVSWIMLRFPLSAYLKTATSELPEKKTGRAGKNFNKIAGLTAIVSFLAGAGIIGIQFLKGEVVNESYFFMGGGLILVSGITAMYYIIRRPGSGKGSSYSLAALGRKNISRNPSRSLGIVILFALGSFLVISTGSNRKDLFKNAGDRNGGTGGFLYFAESTVPVLKNLDDPSVRLEFGLGDGYDFVQLRRSEGDDASCLNLNKIINPAILGVDPGELEGRFSFVSRTDLLDRDHPWQSLEQELQGKLVPAIADETVIKWSLGLKVGDTLKYVDSKGENLDLLLIGGLAPSIFQGNVIISDRYFLERFPESSGTTVFLINGQSSDTAMISDETSMGLRDLGWDMELSSARLAEFNSVTNTYLSIFMVLGALGLLLGTIGLAVILSRSILERKQEIALLKAIGFSIRKIRGHIMSEYMYLLVLGTLIGFTAAVAGTLPSIMSENTGISLTLILAIFGILLLNGWLWTFIMTMGSLRNKTIYESIRNE